MTLTRTPHRRVARSTARGRVPSSLPSAPPGPVRTRARTLTDHPSQEIHDLVSISPPDLGDAWEGIASTLEEWERLADEYGLDPDQFNAVMEREPVKGLGAAEARELFDRLTVSGRALSAYMDYVSKHSDKTCR